MKLNVFAALAAMSTLLFAVSCNKDKVDDSWKQIPTETISAESGDAVLSVNGITGKSGSASLVAESETVGKLTLTGVVPGYSSVDVTVALNKKDESTYSFEGTANLTAPKIVLTRTTEIEPVYLVSANGTVTLDGRIEVAVTTTVYEHHAGDLVGKWNLLRTAEVENYRLTTGPIELKWTAEGDYAGKTSNIESIVMMFGGMAFADCINSVSLLGDGNLTAEYYLPEEFKLGSPTKGEDGKMHFNASHSVWNESLAANFVLWYAADDCLHLVPNVTAIGESLGLETVSLEELLSSLSELVQYGVDTTKLAEVIINMINNGVVFKYSQDGDTLKLTVDKDICDPVVQAFLPALPAVDKLLEEMAQDPEQKDSYSMIKTLLYMLGMKQPSDFSALWNATTEFSISLNFTR